VNATKLIERLKTAVADRDATKERWEQDKLTVLSAHKAYKLAVFAVHEIETEILTGEPARPLLEAVEEKAERTASPKDYHGHATRTPPPPVDVPRRKRERPDAHVAGHLAGPPSVPRPELLPGAEPTPEVLAQRHRVMADDLRKAGAPEAAEILGKEADELIRRHLDDVERQAAETETVVDTRPSPVPRTFVPPSNADRRPVRTAKTDVRSDVTETVDHGPMDIDQALGRALAMSEVRDLLTELVARGVATDQEILDVLKRWPTHRIGYPDGRPGCSWGTTGHENPKFFAGHSARQGNWPMGKPELEGDALIKAVRKYLAIKTPPKTAREAKATFHEPTITANETIVAPGISIVRPPAATAAGTGFATPDVLIAPDPTPYLDRHFAEEAETKRQRTSAATAASVAARARRKTAAAVAAAETNGPSRPYGSNPRRSGAARRARTATAATADRHEKPRQPSRDEIRKGKQPSAVERRTINGKMTFDANGFIVAVPMSGAAWDEADLHNAAEDLRCSFDELILCNRCNRARRTTYHPCPCGSIEYRVHNNPATYRHVNERPAKRKGGRGEKGGGRRAEGGGKKGGTRVHSPV
jgi:hypothetical protein